MADALGGGVATYVKDAEELGDGEAVPVGDAVADDDAFADADALPDGDALAVPVAVAVAEPEASAPVETEGCGDPAVVHPATAAENRTIKVIAPATGVAHTFMEPPAFGIATSGRTENRWSIRNGVFSI